MDQIQPQHLSGAAAVTLAQSSLARNFLSYQVERRYAGYGELDIPGLRESVEVIRDEWTDLDDSSAQDSAPSDERHALIAEDLKRTVEKLIEDWGSDWTEWRYGRIHESELPHMILPGFDLPAVERPGGFGTLDATGANFRRIIDLSNLDRSVGSNSPGQSGQPGSPFYDNLVENLGNGEYFTLVFTREAVEERRAHRLTLRPEAP